MEFITIKPGRILWHARLQPISILYGERKNILNTTDHLFMSPQISQAFLHGLKISKFLFNAPVSSKYYIELTKLVVRKPLRLIHFKTAKDQKNFAIVMNIKKNFNLFSYDDLELLKFICKDTQFIDGYRAHWDQDQIAICARSIPKMKILNSYNFHEDTVLSYFGINSNQVLFKRKPGTAYYVSNNNKHAIGKKITKQIKRYEKANAIRRKLERLRRLRVGSLKNLRRQEAIRRRALRRAGTIPRPVTFKRPALRKKAI